jgi:hypothetical protein
MQCNAIKYNTIQYNAMQCNAMQYIAIHCNHLLFIALAYTSILFHSLSSSGSFSLFVCLLAGWLAGYSSVLLLFNYFRHWYCCFQCCTTMSILQEGEGIQTDWKVFLFFLHGPHLSLLFMLLLLLSSLFVIDPLQRGKQVGKVFFIAFAESPSACLYCFTQ